MEFSVSIKSFADETAKELLDIKKASAIEMANRIVDRSPVGNPALWKTKPPPNYVGGRFKGNWRANIGSLDTSTTTDVDPNGSATKEYIKSDIENATLEQDIYLSNSLPYAVELENGHSTQAPSGMVGITVVEFNDIVKQVAAAK